MSSTRSERIARADKDRCVDSATTTATGSREGVVLYDADFGALHLRYSCVECAVRCTDGGLCGLCKHARYCSKACQAAGWKRIHKRTCGKFPQWPTVESMCGATASQLVDVYTEWAPAHLSVACVAFPRLKIDQLGQNDAERIAGTLSKVVSGLSPTARDDTVGMNWIAQAALLSSSSSCVVDAAIRGSGLPAAMATFFVGAAPRLLELDLVAGESGLSSRNNFVITATVEATANTIFTLGWIPDLKDSGKFAEAAEAAARTLVAFEHRDDFTRRVLDSVPHALLNVIRNATYCGVAPPPGLLVDAFDAFSRKPGLDSASLEVWAHTCGNVAVACGLPCGKLRRRLRAAVRSVCGAYAHIDFAPRVGRPERVVA